ncbi:hypothetical protein HDV00_004902 [Rhizophlyctis rosea]|nr:hypothetical protein HDV00_004902 [Rhizophlyctis rosea]
MTTTKVYPGSCHCGNVTYHLRLTLPPNTDLNSPAPSVKIYKCACTVCHKMGMFHCRPISCTKDFLLTSPSPATLRAYQSVPNGNIRWYFCKNCGVRTFAMEGNFVEDHIDLFEWKGEGRGEKQQVWRSEPSVVNGKPCHYVSVNAVTLEGLDLIKLQKEDGVHYSAGPSGENPPRFGEPYPGGCY